MVTIKQNLAPAKTECPDPGVYRDIRDDVYHSWDALNASKLKALDESPRKLLEAIRGQSKQTDAMVIGSAFHMLALEPKLFDNHYVVKPRGIRKGSAKYNDWAKELRGRLIISDSVFEDLRRMVGSLHDGSNPYVKDLLAKDGDQELSIVWDDPQIGCRCKCRIDRPVPSERTIIDLKTCRSSKWAAFQYNVNDYGYSIQAAWYLRGAQALRKSKRTFVLVAVEKTSPFEVVAYGFNDDTVARSMAHCVHLGKKYVALTKIPHKEWPGHTPPGLNIINVPDSVIPRAEVTCGQT